ncbi:MAG: leucine-rich repeat domain-containing protein [Ruminococcaceae bacterium]|nr:leucine-rich repeat domain-containing protein [Oscillospiraceae bacterium]
MKKRLFSYILVVAILFANLTLFSFSLEEDLQKGFITVESYGTFYTQRVFTDKDNTVFVPITMLAQFGRMSFTEHSTEYIFYRKNETSNSTAKREYLAGARTITIDKAGKGATVSCYVSKNVAKTVSTVKFSKAHTIDKKLYLPLTEALPLLDAKVEITGDGIVHIYANAMSAFYALYAGNADLCVFDAGDMVGGGFISASGLIVDSILNFRFDRLDVVTNSGAIKDYSSLFKKFLVDNETYLSAFDKTETPLDQQITILESEIGDLSDKASGVKDLIKAYEYLFSSAKHSTYKEFSETAKTELHEGVDLIKAVDKIISYADRYTKQVEDHRNMLRAVYQGGSKPAAVAANEVYALYGKETALQITSAATFELRDYLSKILSGKIIGTAGLTPYKIAFSAVEFWLPTMTETWSNAAQLYFLENIVNDAYCVSTDYIKNPVFDEASLERQRLSLIMMLIASKYGYETFYGEDHDIINAIDPWLEKLYLAADSVECVSATYYSKTKAELQKDSGYITLQEDIDPGEEPDPGEDPTPGDDPSVIPSGKCGDNLTWSFENGVLTISGTGEMYDYEYDMETGDATTPWMRWHEERTPFYDEIESVLIEDGVTSIGDWAFYKCPRIESIAIPQSVTSIGARAFSHCSCNSIELPDSVTYIGTAAFRGSGLDSIVVPNSVTCIGDEAFSICSTLECVVIPDSVIYMGGFVFDDCNALTDIFCEIEEDSVDRNNWHPNWNNQYSAIVHWGDSWEYVDGVPTLK